jgi:hypothetical protein
MKLYHKQLHSVEDLKQEKKRLLKKSREMEKEGITSISSIKGFTEGSGVGLGIQSLLKLSSGQTALLKPVLRWLQSKFAKKETPQYFAAYGNYTAGKKKNLLKTAAIEFVGGYLKWKAIELSFKGIRQLIKNRKEKHQYK